jgi:site-specific DNA-methyltransferase (cytosine-N4-specific)
MDARSRESLSDRRPSLVVTSPPYLMAWDYGLYHKFRFYWLGLDLDSYEDSEIGRHLRRKNDDVENYRRDMAQVFAVLRDEMAQSAVIAMVNAPSVVYGQLVDTNAILSEAAALAGWRLNQVLTTLDIPGPHHGMYESLAARRASAPGARGKREHVLLFSR